MTAPKDDLVERLLKVVSGVQCAPGHPDFEGVTNWYRNPDGPEAADHIQSLEADLEKAREALAEETKVADRWRRSHCQQCCQLGVVAVAKTCLEVICPLRNRLSPEDREYNAAWRAGEIKPLSALEGK